jgi:uncharacterized membrane protein
MVNVVELPGGEEFEYTVELRIFYNLEDGTWRLSGDLESNSVNLDAIRQILAAVAANFGTELHGETSSEVARAAKVKDVMDGRCPACGRNKLDDLLNPKKPVMQELFPKKKEGK